MNQTLLTFWQFLCGSLLSFNPKGLCYSYVWSCNLCEVGPSFWMEHMPRNLCRFLCVGLVLIHSVLLLFPLSFSLSLCMVLYPILSNIDEILLISLYGRISSPIQILGASAAASEFCEWFQVGIDLYIPNCKYQVKPQSR